MTTPETQTESAIRIYDARADTYENSWHTDYSHRLVSMIPVQPGQRVLSLCCGTGLDAFLAAESVGDAGHVVGVDVSSGMLRKAAERKESDSRLGPRTSFIRHDVTDLNSLVSPEVRKGSFDFILCSNAFVLFEDPASVVRMWKDYLVPGGRAIIDIPHELNTRSGIAVERVASRMGVKFPSNRSWVENKDTFREVLEKEGYVVEAISEIENVTGDGQTYYTVDQADEHYDRIANSLFTAHAFQGDSKEYARELFRDEFAKLAVDGKIAVVDSLYVYVARKPEE